MILFCFSQSLGTRLPHQRIEELDANGLRGEMENDRKQRDLGTCDMTSLKRGEEKETFALKKHMFL